EGISLYVYNVWSNDGSPRDPLIQSLSQPTEYNNGNPPFTEPVSVPKAAWKSAPLGHLLGKVDGDDMLANKNITIRRGKAGKIVDETTTDANGYFVFTDLQPGNYFVDVDGGTQQKVQVKIQNVTSTTLKQ